MKEGVGMNKKEFEMMNQKLIDGYIDRQKNHAHMLDDDSYPDAKMHRMIMFAEKFNMILFDRIEKISKDRLHIQIYPFTSPKTLSEWCGQRKNVMGVAWICNASGSIETYFMDESGVFYDHTEQKIVINIHN